MSIPNSLEVSDQDDKEKQRLRNLGLQCISPGFSSGKMDERMLTAIQQSKTIARKQKQAIQMMGCGRAEESDEETKAECVPTDGGAGPNEDTTANNAVNGAAGKREETAAEFIPGSAMDHCKEQGAGSSLKRSRVPPPLKIAPASGAGAARIKASLRLSGAQSAPANVTQHTRASCRVQYLGRHPDGRKRAKLGAQPAFGGPYAPYAFYPMPATAMGYPPGAYAPGSYAPGMYASVPYPMVASAAPPRQIPAQPSLQRDFEAFMNQNQSVGTRDVFCNNSSRWAPLRNQPKSAREEFFGLRSRVSGEDSSAVDTRSTASHKSEQDDTEDVDLAIEEGAQPTPMPAGTIAEPKAASVMYGEIRLLHDSFAFQFPMLERNTDKKMFMSICDKVWDDAQALIQE